MSALQAANLFSVEGMVAVITGGATGTMIPFTAFVTVTNTSTTYHVRSSHLQASA